MPAVARKDGADTISTGHGCDTTTTTLTGSNNVFANGIGVVRKNDTSQSHGFPTIITVFVPDPPPPPEDPPPGYIGGTFVDEIVCNPHTVVLTTYSDNVFANDLNIGRLGDSYSGENLITGSPNVFANS
jgi:hypothetical protein